ncbi:MFS transporter [Paenibacillus physcomitrellae]|uniref:MFS transporter n=1 Tax=Paenibacillus physcomitrellae TaxID=1619311 RepID=A0ABQ1FTH2_9BACL|nr:MFS transporter [Paenibacillus physcomitrellae]GGA27798.1 MFS transporter [Paenibacillus physcomitrellae]
MSQALVQQEQANERAAFLKVVTILGLSSVLILSLMYITIPLVPIWADHYKVAQSVAVWTGSAFGFAYALGNIFWGTLSDRFQRIKILYTGLFLLTGATILVGLSPSIGALIALRGLQGLIAASFPAVAIAYVGDVLAPHYRALAISFISCGFLLAGILGQVYATALQASLGWRSAFWILAAVYFIIALFMMKLPKGAVQGTTKASLFQVYAQMLRLFSNGRLLIAWLAAVSILLSFVGMYSALSSFVTEQFHGDSSTLTWIRVAGIPSILLSIGAGSLIKRIGPKKVTVYSLLLAGIGLILEAFSGSLPMLVVASAVFVLGIASAVPGIIVMVGQLGSQARGSATAVYAFFVFVGASMGPILATQLIGYGAKTVFLVLGGIVFLAAVVISIAIRLERA